MKAELKPVGVFDSGVGGLSLLKQLYIQLPYDDIIYVADSKRIPYGLRSEEEIFEFSSQIMQFLKDEGCKLIVIACNTVSGIINEVNEEQLGIPIVGIINYGCISAALYVTYNYLYGKHGNLCLIWI